MPLALPLLSRAVLSCSPWPSCTSAFLFALSLSSNLMPINSKHPCSSPVTIYTPQALHPLLPSLRARLAAKTKLPGVCIHIIGMLKLITCCSRHVVQSCGMYCMQARSAAQRPRTLAQAARWDGYHSWIIIEKKVTMTKWRTLVRTTPSASRCVGGRGEPATCSSGAGAGKKIRKRNRLSVYQPSYKQVYPLCYIHQSEASPLHRDLRDAQETSNTSKAADLSATCYVLLTPR